MSEGRIHYITFGSRPEYYPELKILLTGPSSRIGRHYKIRFKKTTCLGDYETMIGMSLISDPMWDRVRNVIRNVTKKLGVNFMIHQTNENISTFYSRIRIEILKDDFRALNLFDMYKENPRDSHTDILTEFVADGLET